MLGSSSQSGASVAVAAPAAPGLLRLLPAVHHPPARVLLLGLDALGDARALDARGYRVTLVDADAARAAAAGLPVRVADPLGVDFHEVFDVVGETGFFAGLGPEARATYARVVARALRPGGHLVGVFPLAADDLVATFAEAFALGRVEPSVGDRPLTAAVLVKR